MALKPIVSALRKVADDALDMSREARMARAREMGFDTDTTWYHGTPDNRGIREEGFKTRKEQYGVTDDDPRKAFFFSRSPRTAATYADDRRAFDYQNADPEVLKAHLAPGNQAEIDWGGRPFRGDGYALDDEIDRLRSEGYESVLVRNIRDTYNTGGAPDDIVVMLKKEGIRDIEAAFDPAKKDSPNLLAGGAAAAVGLGAASQSEDADAGVITKGGKRIIEAFHGSPHKFDRFSMQNIGTGEGAQAYGHGLYFADSEDVARGYRDDISRWGTRGTTMPDYFAPVSDEARAKFDDVINFADAAPMLVAEELALLPNPTTADALQLLRSKASTPGIKEEYALAYSGMADLLESGDLAFEVPKGSLYRVHLDVDPDTLLDWDRPLSEQPESVKAALAEPIRALAANMGFDEIGDPISWAAKNLNNPSGGDVYQAVKARAPDGGFVASEMMAQGIPGIRYADGMSRGKDGNQTFNYVMFDDAPISIQERGMATPEMLAATATAGGAGMAAQIAMDPDTEAEIDRRITARVRGGQYARRQQKRESRYTALRDSLLSSFDDVTANIANAFRPEEVFNTLEMPQRGLLGLGAGAVGLAQGQGPTSALREAARVAEQPVDQTAYEVGGYVTDETGSPALGAAANAATQFLSPL